MTPDDDFAFREGDSGPSLRDLLTVVFKRWKVIVISIIVVMVGVAVISLIRPPMYNVTATLLVNMARAEVPLAPTDSSHIVVDRLSEQDLNSEVEILKSRSLIEEVLKTLGVDESWRPKGNRVSEAIRSLRNRVRSMLGMKELSFFDEMVLHLGRKLEITTVPRSNLLRLNYASRNPERATKIVRTLTERYIERRVERYQSPQVLSFFQQQMREAEARLNEREKALEDFSKAAGVTITKGPEDGDSLAAEKKTLLDRLAKFQNDLGDAEADMHEQSDMIANLKSRLAKEPERLASPSRDLQDAATQVIEERLASLQLQRDALLQDYKPDSRYVKDIEAQIEAAKNRLHDAEARTGNIEGTEVNPIYQSLKGDLLHAEAALDGTRGRFNSLKQQVDQCQAALESLNDKAFRLEALRRDAQSAEDEYLLYRKKHEEARISAAMDKQRLINVTIAQPAQEPLEPMDSGVKLRMLLGLLVGVIGGLGLAFATELYLDHSFTTGYEMERRLGIPHIASIPEGSL